MQSTFSDSTYDEYKIIQKDAAMVYWKVVSQNLPWWTEENYKLLVRTAKLWAMFGNHNLLKMKHEYEPTVCNIQRYLFPLQLRPTQG